VNPTQDFFISYNHHDQAWAEWLAWTLEAAGYSVIIDAWDFRAGGNFVLEMDKAMKQTRQTIALLSQNYLNAEYVHPEWAAAFAKDAQGNQRSLLTVRIAPCEPGGILGLITRIDLLGLEEAAAKTTVLAALKQRGKPEHPPEFPGFGAAIFPGGIPQNLPYSGASTFVGREEELNRLHELLQQGGQVAIASLQGMGGIGKTELALQYALRHFQSTTYPGGICWLSARDQQLGIQILLFAQDKLKLQLPEEPNLVRLVQFCWNHWRSGNTLIIIDDVPHYAAIRDYLPPAAESRFRVLLTTRSHLDSPIRALDLAVLKPEDAIALLTALVPDGRIEQQPTEAAALCQWLGNLPLGIELVGRYLAFKPDLSLTEMQHRLEQQRLQQRALQTVADTMTAERGVEAAFELSWQILNPEAQDLGSLLSLFALAPIPWNLVEDCHPETDREALEDIRDRLVNLHLLNRVKAKHYQLHPLIQQFFADKLNTHEQAADFRSSVAAATANIARDIPDALTLADVENVRAAIPHMENSATHHLDAFSDEDLIWIFTGIGQFYGGQGIYAQAEPWCEACLTVITEKLGNRHPDVATSLNNLAGLYRNQGRYEAAEPLLVEALPLFKDLLGDRHPDVASNLNNLAELYRNQGRYEAAEPLYVEALPLFKDLLGDRHPDVAQSLNNLAVLRYNQNRFAEAESLLLQALEIRQQVLGNTHPDTLITQQSLAYLRQAMHRTTSNTALLTPLQWLIAIPLIPFYLLFKFIRWCIRKLRKTKPRN
jgi:tetratricopeptide (TPR) repeat protein